MNTEMPESETPDPLENILKSMRPSPISDDLLNRLSAAMNEAAAQPANIISMEVAREKIRQKSPFLMQKWSWAAALAVLGAASAFILTDNPASNTGLAQHSTAPRVDNTVNDSASTRAGNSIPVAYDGIGSPASYTGPAQPLNQRTIWLNNESPHKYIQVNYTKNCPVKDKDGRVIEIPVPATRYILIPDEVY